MADDFSPRSREALELFLIVGHEVADVARALRADYVSAQLRLEHDEPLVFAYERGRVTVTGEGFGAGAHPAAGLVVAVTPIGWGRDEVSSRGPLCQ